MLTFDKSILIENIKQLMKERDITQPQLAKELNIGQPSISKCLSGKQQSISIDFVFSIAQYFDVTIDSLCANISDTVAKTETDTTSVPALPVHIAAFIDICSGLAAIFKSAYLCTKEVDYREVVYKEVLDDHYQSTGEYYRYEDELHMDPSNKYISFFFPNYHEIISAFPDEDTADDYFSDLHYQGNTIDNNVKINYFLKQLTDLHTIYKNGSMTDEAYYHAIDSNLSNILDK